MKIDDLVATEVGLRYDGPMLTTEQLLNGLPPDLTLQFFATFARFEFALKCAGCLQLLEDGSVAMASRVRLRDRLPGSFFQMVEASSAAEALIARPAKNLFVQADGPPEFGQQQPRLQDTRHLLDALWRVRNNLFHGNKMNPADRDRDAALMTAALAVIEFVLEIDGEIASAFHEPQQFF